MLNKFKQILDSMTMYQVVLYCLVARVAFVLVLSATGRLGYSSFGSLTVMLVLLAAVCFAADRVISRLYSIAIAKESAIITALILFFVLSAPSSTGQWLGIALAGLAAIASKYLITWRGANIFNPAALGVLVVSLLGVGEGAWWVASSVMFWPSLIIAGLVLTKVRRWGMFMGFLVPAVLIILVDTTGSLTDLASSIGTTLTLYPLIFLGSIMLTEPSTAPSTSQYRLIYGAIVGVLLASKVELGFLGASPHLALLVGNIFAFIVSNRSSVRLALLRKVQLSPTTYAFEFKPDRPVRFSAGQYMDLTLPGVKLDTRSNRRTFTIAAAPESQIIRFGVKFYANGSQFKQRLASLKPSEQIIGNHTGGDFILPATTAKPLVFIAGGIGVTPFIAMIEHMLKTGKKYQVTLYYFASDKTEIVFKDLLNRAASAGIKTIPKVGKGERLSEQDIAANREAIFYLSGPPGLVSGYKAQIKSLGVKNIHTDYFFGY